MSMQNKLLITQSLLSSWNYLYKKEDGMDEFISALLRKRTPPTKAMLDGTRFEGMVNAVCNGRPLEEENDLYPVVMQTADIVRGAQQQVKLSRNMVIGGINFVLYGVLDYLKAGVIYDTKFSKTYHYGKYLDSPQHPMYFALVPEAKRFEYIICDGSWVYREAYEPDDVEPIERTIEQFLKFLDRHDLFGLYSENWRSKY